MTTCKIKSCTNSVRARGWCRKHYQRWYKHGNPKVTVNQSGRNNPNYRHGDYAFPSYCDCGREKDFRAEKCAICSRSSYSINEEELIDKDRLVKEVKNSSSYLEVSNKLNVSRGYVTRRVEEYNLDISHFVPGRNRKIPKEDLFVRNSKVTRGTIRRRVIEEEILEYKCVICDNNGQWNGRNLTLQLDHINGDSSDNRVKNLRWLCPNCHSQTTTYTGKNIRREV